MSVTHWKHVTEVQDIVAVEGERNAEAERSRCRIY